MNLSKDVNNFMILSKPVLLGLLLLPCVIFATNESIDHSTDLYSPQEALSAESTSKLEAYFSTLNKNIYPFKPMATQEIIRRSQKFSEDENPILNLFTMDEMGLNRKNLTHRPWGGSYWPMNRGIIANNYALNKSHQLRKRLGWKLNLKKWDERKSSLKKSTADTNKMTQYQLNRLSPSEKYDLVMGHKNFDLTTRIWDYVRRWGLKKKYGFLYSINLPGLDWSVEENDEGISLWEGICHGWATASGVVPRPKNSVWVPLPNGQKIKFYPNDIKALVSFMWANSIIQDHIKMEGYRCNQGFFAKKDPYGRYIDPVPTDKNEQHLPRCADVHPAVLHIALANNMALQDRSFVMDISAKAKVSNQPLSGFYSYFYSLKTFKYGKLKNVVEPIESIKDQFSPARNPQAKYLVGVRTTIKYVDWKSPVLSGIDKKTYDRIKLKTFYYDLELDQKGNIVGGQWRSSKRSKPLFKLFASTHQPDFIWSVPKNWKDFFQGASSVPQWEDNSKPVPTEWKQASRLAHMFTYKMTKDFGYNHKCTVVHNETKEEKKVDCEFEYPRPQPLAQFVNRLVELSSADQIEQDGLEKNQNQE